jgi:hypothetical protein
LLGLAGSWKDKRSAEEIINEMYHARKSKTKSVKLS